MPGLARGGKRFGGMPPRGILRPNARFFVPRLISNVGKESEHPREMRGPSQVQVRMLGPMAIHRDGVAVALPASRKVRALLAYLALAPLPVSSSELCDLLWDVPSDPRGELRWC